MRQHGVGRRHLPNLLGHKQLVPPPGCAPLPRIPPAAELLEFLEELQRGGVVRRAPHVVATSRLPERVTSRRAHLDIDADADADVWKM